MRRVLLFIGVFAIGAVGLAVSGIMDRAKSRQEVAAWTNAQTVPTVRVVQPERGPGEQELVLPGNVAAFNTGSLFARASGYIAAWNKDIGAHVTKGEVLATISAPDLDQQLEQAKGQLVQLRRRSNKRRPTRTSATQRISGPHSSSFKGGRVSNRAITIA